MKVLVLGGNGMAGHMIKDYLTEATSYEIYYTIRGNSEEERCFTLDVLDEQSVEALLKQLKPDLVINTTGLLNDNAASLFMEAIYVNSLFPHKLSLYGRQYGFKVIHISTDCVFSGDRGDYTENERKDGTSVYAKTKSLGEIIDNSNITIRTSIIGPELKKEGTGLFHWFMHQSGEILGYQSVYWNGVTTLELAKAIEWLIPRSISGLVQLTGAKKISKFELLNLIKKEFKRDSIVIKAYDQVKSDKSLLNTRSDFLYKASSYSQMLAELKGWMDSRKKGIYQYT
ncbi:SDR family oxidoreductase [Bacillus sp. V2I10]|uniref:dTDP-4-dehydrorhamnose reductase family protein n=1 Tax=Bacillus sp. V2I10 TaxID=3042276 RepID=UPI00278233C2|nr:SDR family oxidoreductase [Bacillus sp. V2I10]MDQ0857344.1 dTDP-4-dehydrorhamnose reductase [Bacillus sp. V2I10]